MGCHGVVDRRLSGASSGSGHGTTLAGQRRARLREHCRRGYHGRGGRVNAVAAHG
jgi:hypothetical protein